MDGAQRFQAFTEYRTGDRVFTLPVLLQTFVAVPRIRPSAALPLRAGCLTKAAVACLLPAQKPAQNPPKPARNPLEMRRGDTYLQ